jgi:hypothetical protein
VSFFKAVSGPAWRVGLALLCAAGAAAGGQGRPGVWIEFDVPHDQQAVYYMVGYFGDDASETPLASYRVPRADATRMSAGRLRVPIHGLRSPDTTSIVVKIRTVTAEGTSSWSAQGTRIDVAELAQLQPVETPGAAPTGPDPDAEAPDPKRIARRQLVTERALAGNARLREALGKRFPDIDLVRAAQGYERLENFVAALVASRAHGIPFETLKPYTTARRSQLQAGLKAARSSLDARAEARKAQAEARSLIQAARPAAKGGK